MPQKIRILYVEDDEPLGDLFKYIVTGLGYDVDVAVTGAAGLSMYDAAPHDIVFLDYKLPDTDGISIARKMLLDDPEKLIVVVTGEGSERLASEALSMGVSDYIVKDSQTVFVELIPSIIATLVRTLEQKHYKKEAEQRYQALLDEMLDAAIVHTDSIVVYANKVACELYGASSLDQLIGRSPSDLVSDADANIQSDRIAAVTSDKYLPPIELMARKLDGSLFPIETRAKAIVWQGANSIIAVLRDITKRKEAAFKLVESEQKYRSLIDGSLQGIVIIRDGKILFANEAAAKMHGYEDVNELISVGSSLELAAETDREMIALRAEQRLSGVNIAPNFEYKGLHKRGHEIWIEARSQLVEWDGRPATQSTLIDVSERAKEQEKYQSIVDGSIQGILLHRDGKILFANDAIASIHGYENATEIMSLESTLMLSPEFEHEQIIERMRNRDSGKYVSSDYEHVGLHKTGRHILIESRSRSMDWEGAPAALVTMVDVTENQLSKAKLVESEQKYRSLIDGSLQGIVIHRDWKILFANKSYAKIKKYSSPDELIGTDLLSDLVSPQERAELEARMSRRLSGENPENQYEVSSTLRDGTSVWLDCLVSNIEWEGLSAIQSTVVDISERRLAQEKLRQSQRMESVGQLTGGVAHDFNNLLQVFGGAGTMIENFKGAPDQQDKWIDSIYKAVDRGKSLTGQLLSFSRQQTLTPEVSSPRDAIFGIKELLKRTLGEDIQFMVSCPDDIPLVHIDVHGLQNAIVNLCINAAAAMKNGGSLAIDVKPVTLEVPVSDDQESLPAGDYVEIAVSDTGTGMDAETVSKAFDPFFTTKAVDEGTGLGLSMVYGFTKQSGGLASIESKLGKGTTVSLLFPVSVVEAEEKIEHREVFSGTKPSASILVVEDDLDVRETTKAVLEAIGHKVSEAVDATSALEILQRDNSFDIVFSDIVMPGGMSGIELAEEMASIPNAPKILLTSGYPDRLKELKGKSLDSTVNILAKPFSMGEIESAVTTMLQEE